MEWMPWRTRSRWRTWEAPVDLPCASSWTARRHLKSSAWLCRIRSILKEAAWHHLRHLKAGWTWLSHAEACWTWFSCFSWFFPMWLGDRGWNMMKHAEIEDVTGLASGNGDTRIDMHQVHGLCDGCGWGMDSPLVRALLKWLREGGTLVAVVFIMFFSENRRPKVPLIIICPIGIATLGCTPFPRFQTQSES